LIFVRLLSPNPVTPSLLDIDIDSFQMTVDRLREKLLYMADLELVVAESQIMAPTSVDPFLLAI
jgi:hypothetical protein